MGRGGTNVRMRLLVALALIALASGCNTQSQRPSSDTKLRGAAAVLVAIDASGGRCVQGLCASHTVVRADGSVVRDTTLLGVAPATQIERLRALIAGTDFVKIRAVPPPGSLPFPGCQSAVDGRDLKYSFHSGQPGAQMVDGCATAIDFNSPLFALIEQIVSSASPGR
jgi:uncharacterized protein YceK